MEWAQKAMNAEVIAADQVELRMSRTGIGFSLAHDCSASSASAHLVMTLKTYQEIEACLRSQIYEALDELSRYDPEQSGIDIEESSEAGSTATVAESQPMGGQVQAAEF
jgi:hypothetical protein